MLIGLVTIAIPIIIHLLNRRKAEVIEWGAMQFLLDSVVSRKRRILIEEILLLLLRCLLLALLVLAMARPLIPAGAGVQWAVVLPAVLLGVSALGAAAAVWQHRNWRWVLLGTGSGLLLLALVAIVAEHSLQLRRWGGGGDQDVAIVIDGSQSMSLSVDGKSNFDRAVGEAMVIVETLGLGDAASIILGGDGPTILTPTPLSDRKKLKAILQELRPGPGSMAVVDSLQAAALTLAEGQNPQKRIVLLTDGQAVGWDVNNTARWQFVRGLLRDLVPGTQDAKDDKPPPVTFFCRLLPAKKDLRNAALADISFSRDVIGTDRSVGIRVRVENTGHEAISPSSIQLEVDGKELTTPGLVGQLAAGAAETVEFRHRFKRDPKLAGGGLHTVVAKLAQPDEMAADNTAVRILRTMESLKVLIVDGNPVGRPLERASAFLDIALNPSEEEDGKPVTADKFIQTKIVSATDAATETDLSEYEVIVLANVPQLPAGVAQRLQKFVADGGGLLIGLGDRAAPEFYNNWKTENGRPFAGATVAERKSLGDGAAPAKPVLTTFTHRAMQAVADINQSDIDRLEVTAYWKLQLDAADDSSRAGGLLNTGDPLVVERRLGKGQVLTTAVAFEPLGSNLPILRCFVPWVHEIVYYLVGTVSGSDLNLPPSNSLRVTLRTDELTTSTTNGLVGDYYGGDSFDRFIFSRVDPSIKFSWNEPPDPRVPSEKFSVRWTGSINPRFSEEYTFYLRSDSGAKLWIDDKPVISSRRGEKSGRIKLEADQSYDLRLEYSDHKRGSSITFFWASASQPREVVPSDQLSPQRPLPRQFSAEETAQWLGPEGAKSVAKLSVQGETLIAQVQGVVDPGIYRLLLPDFLHGPFQRLLDRDKTLPVAVSAGAVEGHLALLSQADWDNVSRHVHLVRAESNQELMAGLIRGGVPGQELWKYLAIAALFALLGEIALTRWIAQRRQMGTIETVSFTSSPGQSGRAAFRARAREWVKVNDN